MRGSADDDTLPPERRRELLLKKLARWHRDPSGHSVSARKLQKLRRLMRELGVDDLDSLRKSESLRDLVKVLEVMES